MQYNATCVSSCRCLTLTEKLAIRRLFRASCDKTNNWKDIL